jgi:hypothetical protein
VPDSEGGMYHVTEVIKVHLPAGQQYKVMMESLEGASANNVSFSWAIDSMLIDEDMLYLEDAEADRMY